MRQSPLRIGISASGTGVGQSILASARLSRLPSYVVGMADSHHEFDSQRFDDLANLPPIRDPEYVESLLQACIAKGIELLFLGHDDELQSVSELRSRYQDSGVRVVVGPYNIVKSARDKSQLGSDEIFPKKYAARTLRLGGGHSDAYFEGFPFPAVVKPAGGSASENVHLIESLDQFLGNDWGDDMILQEFIFPKERDVSSMLRHDVGKGLLSQKSEISVQLLFGHDGLLGHFVSENDLQRGVPVSIRGRLISEVERFVPIVTGMLTKSDMYGPINFQGRVSGDGFKIFEVNPRFTGITSTRAYLGFNEVDAIMRDHRNLSFPGSALRQNFTRNAIRELSSVSFVPRSSGSSAENAQIIPPSRHKKVLVFGGVGYLGFEISASLQRQGHHLTVSTRRPGSQDSRNFFQKLPSEVEVVDTRDFLSGARSVAEFDTVVMVGFARPIHGKDALVDSLQLFAEFVSLCAQAQVETLINISSRSVYGKYPKLDDSGDFIINPGSAYGIAKYASELLLETSKARDSFTNYLNLRIGRLFGPNPFCRREEFPHRLVCAATAGEKVTLRGEDSGFDLVDVRDVGELVARLVGMDARELPRGWVDVGGTNVYSATQLIAIVQEVTGGHIDVVEVGYSDQENSQSGLAIGLSKSRIRRAWFPTRTVQATFEDCMDEWRTE